MKKEKNRSAESFIIILNEWLRRESMKFYTIKLPKFLGGIVRAMLGSFKKD
jgi:stage V sporulation protein M